MPLVKGSQGLKMLVPNLVAGSCGELRGGPRKLRGVAGTCGEVAVLMDFHMDFDDFLVFFIILQILMIFLFFSLFYRRYDNFMVSAIFAKIT